MLISFSILEITILFCFTFFEAQNLDHILQQTVASPSKVPMTIDERKRIGQVLCYSMFTILRKQKSGAHQAGPAFFLIPIHFQF